MEYIQRRVASLNPGVWKKKWNLPSTWSVLTRSMMTNYICVCSCHSSISHCKQSCLGSNRTPLYLPLPLSVHCMWFMQVRQWVNIPSEHRCELLTHTSILTSAGLFNLSQGKEVFEWGMRGAWRRGRRWEGWSWQREIQWRRDRGGKCDRLWFEAEESQLHWEGTVLCIITEMFM